MSVCCDYCVLSGRGLCVGLIIRPEESYRMWCVCVWPTGGCCVMVKKKTHQRFEEATVSADVSTRFKLDSLRHFQ